MMKENFENKSMEQKEEKARPDKQDSRGKVRNPQSADNQKEMKQADDRQADTNENHFKR